VASSQQEASRQRETQLASETASTAADLVLQAELQLHSERQLSAKLGKEKEIYLKQLATARQEAANAMSAAAAAASAAAAAVAGADSSLNNNNKNYSPGGTVGSTRSSRNKERDSDKTDNSRAPSPSSVAEQPLGFAVRDSFSAGAPLSVYMLAEELRAELQLQRDSHEALTAEKRALDEKLLEALHALTAMEARLESSTTQETELRSRVAPLEAQVESLQGEVSSSRKQAENQSSAATLALSSADSLEQQLAKAIVRCSQLEGTVAQQTEQSAASAARMEALEAQVHILNFLSLSFPLSLFLSFFLSFFTKERSV
jgi:hypothetical protein